MTAARPRFRFGPHDLVELDGVAHRWMRSTAEGHLLEPVGQPGVTVSLTDDDVAARMASAGYRYARDWFAPGRAEARLATGVGDLHDVPARELPALLWRHRWCEEFLRLERAGDATRSDAGKLAAIRRIRPQMEEFMANQQKAAEDAARARGGPKKRRDAAVAAAIARVRAGVRHSVTDTAMIRRLGRWLARYEAGGDDVTALRNHYFRSGNRDPRFAPEILVLIRDHARGYAAENRPTKAQIHLDLRAAIDGLNLVRKAEGLPAHPSVSYDVVSDAIARLPAFAVHAARHGIEAAKRRFRIRGQGLDVERAGQRLEMDDWLTQLHVILIEVGIWEELSDETKKLVIRIRVWIVLVLDAASRCVLGISVAENPSTAAAAAALHMAVRDKSGVAALYGAQTEWEMCCTPESVATDAGSAYVADAFKACVLGLRSRIDTMPAGMPHLRGRNERIFRTTHDGAVARLPGRTFENVVARGDYDAESRAGIDLTQFILLIMRWILDVYHNTPHDGLGGETPRNAWRRLEGAYSVLPPPGRDVCRNIFGVAVTRRTGPHGLRVMSLCYQCAELQAHRRRVGDVDVDVRVDLQDLGRVSVRIDDVWHNCPNRTAGYDDVPVSTWLQALADLRRRFSAEASLSEAVVLQAVRDLQVMVAAGVERFGLGSLTIDQAVIDRAEGQLTIGVELPTADGTGASPPAADILANAIPGTGPGNAAPEETTPADGDDGTRRTRKVEIRYDE